MNIGFVSTSVPRIARCYVAEYIHFLAQMNTGLVNTSVPRFAMSDVAEYMHLYMQMNIGFVSTSVPRFAACDVIRVFVCASEHRVCKQIGVEVCKVHICRTHSFLWASEPLKGW